MTEASGALSRSKAMSEIVSRRTSAVSTAKTADSRFASIQENPFYSTMLSTSLSPTEKVVETAKLLSAPTTAAEMKAAVEAMENFKAYVQDKREEVASALLKMVDTTTMAELQATYENINRDLDKFNQDMDPLLRIVDAVYKIRMSSPTGTIDAYKAIKDASVADAERTARRVDAETRFSNLEREIQRLNSDISVESTKKTLFGFGDIQPEAKANIARMETDRASKLLELESISNEITAIQAEAATSLGAGTDLDPQALAELKKFLDLNSEEHTQRQKNLVESAVNFIKTTKERVTSITSHLEGQDQKLDEIGNSNQQFTGIYAILNEATTKGQGDVLKLRETLATAPEGETKVEKMERETRLQAVDEYLLRLQTTAADTDLTYADMTGGQIRINSMKTANRNQIDKAKAMQTRGVAGVADRLVTTVTAVSTAAINEAQAAARQTAQAVADDEAS